MSSIFEHAVVGPQIDPTATDWLQTAVTRKLMTQVEETILTTAEFSPEPTETLAALMALRVFPLERQRRIILHPTFRYWLQAMRRINPEDLQQRKRFVRQITDFVWAHQAVSGALQRSWTVMTDERGGLRCPALGRWIELGEAYAQQIVTIEPGTENIIVRCQDGLTIQIPPEDLNGPVTDPPTIEEHGYWVNIAPYVVDGQIEVSTRDPWLRVKLTGTNQRTNGTEFFGISSDLYPEQPPLENLVTALSLIQQFWPEQHTDLAQYSHVIVPMDFGPHNHRAFTVSSRQGAIFIGEAPPDPMVEMLLHENAHVKLRQIQYLDPLLVDPLDESIRVPVPWRPDPRPMPGVFEGVFVFAHIAEFEWRRYQHDSTSVDVHHLASRLRDLQYATDQLAQNARLTLEGERFFLAMKHWVGELKERVEHSQAL
jgi:HEXXH motif-containing protein